MANRKVNILIGPNQCLYLANTSDEDITLGPCELFGFGLGTWSEVMTSKTRGAKDFLPFTLKQDSDLVVYQESDGSKKPYTIACLICDAAVQHGIVDVNLTDHNLEAAVGEARANNRAFIFE